MEELDYYIYEHSDPKLKTLGALLKFPGYIFYGKKAVDVLAFKDINGITNEDRLLSALIGQEKIKPGKDDDFILTQGVMLVIPKVLANKSAGSVAIGKNIKVVTAPDTAFKAKVLLELELDKGYQVLTKSQDTTIANEYPQATVWAWVRALSKIGTQEGQLIDLSPFIISLSTNVGKNGGGFSIQLAPITCRVDSVTGNWILKKEEVSFYKHQGKINYVASHAAFERNAKGKLKRSKIFFHSIISSNDLVFIKFETLKLEASERLADSSKLLVSPKDLPNKIYDMIGLVDSSTLAYQAEAVDFSVSIQGRDLSKLIIEDGAYYFPSIYAEEGIRGTQEFVRGLGGELTALARFQLNTVPQIIKYCLDMLAGITICPDSLTKYYSKSAINVQNQITAKQSESNGLLSLTDDFRTGAFTLIDEIVQARFQYQTVSTFEKQDIFNRLTELCDQAEAFDKLILNVGINEGFVYQGYTSYFINDLPYQNFSDIFLPINEEYAKTGCLLDAKDEKLLALCANFIFNKANYTLKEPPKTSTYPTGIWSLINLVFDPSVSDRTVADYSLSTASGSFLNFFRKVCQEPFVEFYSDTYFDRFYFTARVPPFTKKLLLSYLDGRYTSETKAENDDTKKNSVIEIQEHQVISDSLEFNDQEAHSWFHLTPKTAIQGLGQTIALWYSAPKVFPELVEIFGNRLMQITNNYLYYDPYFYQENKKEQQKTIEAQSCEDLIFMIESNVHLPFTRKGTITIQGDRRLKRGQYLYYAPTNEIYYIDNVQQSYSVRDTSQDRTTTIQVSRGMVREYIQGIKVEGIEKPVSYFSIVNLDLNFNDFIKTKTVTNQIKDKPAGQPDEKTSQDASDDVKEASGPSSSQAATRISTSSLSRLKSSLGEGFRNFVYKDANGFSGGYGHFLSPAELKAYPPGTKLPNSVTSNWLTEDVQSRELSISAVYSNMYQEEFDQVFDLIYNTAKTAYTFSAVFNQFDLHLKGYLANRSQANGKRLRRTWASTAVTAKGSVGKSAGLVARRLFEIEGFFSKDRLGQTKQAVDKVQDQAKAKVEETNDLKDQPTTTTSTYLDRVKILKAIAVNKDVLNFFLCRRQLDKLG